MRPQTGLFFIALALCLATSCKRHTRKPIGRHTDIYLAGNIRKYYSKQDKDTISTAVYWKNGDVTQLSDSVTSAVVKAIAVRGNDVYVVGYISRKVNSSYETGSAVYWKNGVQTQLGQGVINGIAFSGNDVYMVGTAWGKGQDQAVYWKNGKAFSLGKGRLESIFIEGDDVYIVGCRLYTVESPGTSDLATNKSYYPAATYWKNGDVVALNDTTSGNTTINGIFVQDGNVYAAGSEQEQYSKAVYWATGHPHELVYTPHPMGWASGIVVDEHGRGTVCGDIYVGQNNYIAVYWGNGRLVSLPRMGKHSNANAIGILGTDVYIAGSDQGYPVYWRNGRRYQIGKTGGMVNAIAIVNY